MWDTCLRVGQDTFFHDPGVEPCPDQPHHPPILNPFTQHFSSSGPVDTVAVSTDICLHDPADPLRHALLTSRMPCLMGAATLSKALGAVTAILLIDGFQQHRHCSLDHLVLERRLPNQTLPSIVLVEPDALDRGGLGAPTA